MDKPKRNKVKTSRFEMRTSIEFTELLSKLSEKKGMSKPFLIEYLVRREAENENIK